MRNRRNLPSRPAECQHPFWEPVDLDRLARTDGVRPVQDPAELRAPVWESEEELEDFLAEVYAWRLCGGS